MALAKLAALPVRQRRKGYRGYTNPRGYIETKDCDDYRKPYTRELPRLGINLDDYTFSAEVDIDDDGSIILCLKEISCLIESGVDEKAARLAMGKEILSFADDYFHERWYNTAWLSYLPYVLKALLNGDPKAIGDEIVCQPGNN